MFRNQSQPMQSKNRLKLPKKLGFLVLFDLRLLWVTGGGIAYNAEEVEQISKAGIDNSLISEVLIEKSILGWKEYGLEVMRDKNDNVVIVCAIENFELMGVHTGDSLQLPAQTLTVLSIKIWKSNKKSFAKSMVKPVGRISSFS